jgi:hypothetical protein
LRSNGRTWSAQHNTPTPLSLHHLVNLYPMLSVVLLYM